jgi:glycosyltransferase involved in cell wall biosynthesis
MNRQQLLSRLAANGAFVVYSTGQWYSWHRHDPAWRAAPAFGRVQHADGVRIAHAPRWLLRVPRSPRLDRLAIRLEARRLRRLLPNAGRAGFTLYVFHPVFQPYAEALQPTRLVYHAYDLFALTPDWNTELARQEQWLLDHADLRIASSGITAARLEDRGGRCVQTLPNAADVRRFDRARHEPPPPDLAAIPRPWIGYVGNINIKVDLALIAELAARRPQWQFVLIGQVGVLDNEASEALARCRGLPNIHELGGKAYTEVPGYVAQIDVGLMAYRIRANLWTTALEPLKLYEYLAAGRPVVSAGMAAIERFRDVVSVAGSAEEWEYAIAAALNGDGASPERRRAAGAKHDWSARVATLQKWLTGLSVPDGPRRHQGTVEALPESGLPFDR